MTNHPALRRLLPLAAALCVAAAVAAAPRGMGQEASRASGQASQIPTVANNDAEGYRLWVLLFDVSSMQADDITRAKAVALKWINTGMGEDDLVSVVTIGTSLKLLENFTMNVPRVRTAVTGLGAGPDAGAPPQDQALLERDIFNNDLRLRGLRTLCTGLRVIPQKKNLMYFTASRERPGDDNQVELLATTDACNQSRTAINTLDMHVGGGTR